MGVCCYGSVLLPAELPAHRWSKVHLPFQWEGDSKAEYDILLGAELSVGLTPCTER
jgi:hypothetical protein